jgi:rhodanese-related sulfurtransferase
MQKKLYLIILLSIILQINCAHQGFSKQTQIIIEKGTLNSSELKKLIDNESKDYLLIDVRSESEYNSGYIPTAINIPHTNIEEHIEEIPRDKLIIVYCKVGGRAENARKKLIELGYKNVINFGGTNSWKYKLVK